MASGTKFDDEFDNIFSLDDPITDDLEEILNSEVNLKLAPEQELRYKEVLDVTQVLSFPDGVKKELPDFIKRIFSNGNYNQISNVCLLNSLRNLSRFKKIDPERIGRTLIYEYLTITEICEEQESDKPNSFDDTTSLEDRFSGLIESFNTFREKNYFCNQESFFSSLYSVRDIIKKFLTLTPKTLGNISKLLSVFLPLSPEYLLENDWDTIRTSREAISYYLSIVKQLDDPQTINAFESTFGSFLRENPSGNIDEVERELIVRKEIAELINPFSSEAKPYLIYFYNYLCKKSVPEERTYLIKDSTKFFDENLPKLLDINSKCYYGVFMRLAFTQCFRNDKQGCDLSALEEIFNKDIDDVLPLSNFLDNLNIDLNIDLSVDSVNDPDDSLLTKYQDLRQPYDEFWFFNSLSFYYLSRTESEKKQCLFDLEIMKHDPLSMLMANRSLSSWNPKDKNNRVEEELNIIACLYAGGFSIEEKIKAHSSLSPFQDPEYNQKFRRLLGNLNDINEICECAEINMQIGDYDVIRRLGFGSGGSVYLINSKNMKRKRVLKIIKEEKHRKEETELMARLKGKDLDNIVQIHEAGENIAVVAGEEKYAIVMEYIDGQTLRELVDAGPLSKDKVLEYGTQIFNGILSLQSYGITHRDLNLKNIKVNSDGVVKILDLGIATDENEPKGKDARRFGVPSDMKSNDLFSLGLILYQLSSGDHLILEKRDRSSYSHAEEVAILKEKLYENNQIASLYQEKICGNIPKELQAIIYACLENPIGNVEDVKEAFEQTRDDLRYYLMDKTDLIARIHELESKDNLVIKK